MQSNTIRAQALDLLNTLKDSLTMQLSHPNVQSSASLTKVVKGFIMRLASFMQEVKNSQDVLVLIEQSLLIDEIEEWNQSSAIHSSNILIPEQVQKILLAVAKGEIGLKLINHCSKDDADRQSNLQKAEDALSSFAFPQLDTYIEQVRLIKELLKPDKFGCVIVTPQLKECLKVVCPKNETDAFRSYLEAMGNFQYKGQQM